MSLISLYNVFNREKLLKAHLPLLAIPYKVVPYKTLCGYFGSGISLKGHRDRPVRQLSLGRRSGDRQETRNVRQESNQQPLILTFIHPTAGVSFYGLGKAKYRNWLSFGALGGHKTSLFPFPAHLRLSCTMNAETETLA